MDRGFVIVTYANGPREYAGDFFVYDSKFQAMKAAAETWGTIKGLSFDPATPSEIKMHLQGQRLRAGRGTHRYVA
jgi:hypothetical protein